jgi:hypothetical protein
MTVRTQSPTKSARISGASCVNMMVVGGELIFEGACAGASIEFISTKTGRVMLFACVDPKEQSPKDAALEKQIDAELCDIPEVWACAFRGEIHVVGTARSDEEKAKLREVRKRYPKVRFKYEEEEE